MADGAAGVTQLPAPVAAAASWDTDLIGRYGQTIGAEEWGKGATVVLGPTINIVRDPRWGRAFESLGEDPYLAAQMGAADIAGIRSQGPMVQVKHYADYNQETYRNNPQDDVVMSDRTQQEIYLPAFAAAVQQAHADSVMCSYASVAGTFACESGHLLDDILRGQLGFDGFVTSDWGGTHSTVAAANHGLDQEMNGSDFYGAALTNAVNAGQVSMATIDTHVRRILVAMFRAGLFDNPPAGTITTPVSSDAHRAVATQVAAAGQRPAEERERAAGRVFGAIDRGHRRRRRRQRDDRRRGQRAREPVALDQPVRGNQEPGRQWRRRQLCAGGGRPERRARRQPVP